MNSENKPSGVLGDFKFNTVGREEAAVEVLRPRIDPATKTRNLIFGVVAALALAGILYFSYRATGGDIFKSPSNKTPFAPPDHNVNGL